MYDTPHPFEMLMFHWTIKSVFEDLDSRGLTDSLV